MIRARVQHMVAQMTRCILVSILKAYLCISVSNKYHYAEEGTIKRPCLTVYP